MDVTVLTFAVYTVAAILPLSPIAVAPHLADLFEVFSRLVTWKDKGKAGGWTCLWGMCVLCYAKYVSYEISELCHKWAVLCFTACCMPSPVLPSHTARIPHLLLHLEGGVYHFFLQLYAMFPCNFVNYLKARYGPKGEAAIFKKYIAVSNTCMHYMDTHCHP